MVQNWMPLLLSILFASNRPNQWIKLQPDQLTIPLYKLPCSLPVMSHGIPEEYSQNPDHIHKISGHTLWYKDLKKLKGKSKMVEGDLAKYR